MNMNFKFLFLGTSLSLIPNLLYAQCVPAQSCAELGYKETTNKGGCLKCPFGNGYYCPERCEASYQYTCTGANEVKPSSAACSNRYEKCDCNSGYEWNSGACKQCAGKYKYTCTGANESKGADSCGGKYSACQCATNYEWNSTSGKCESVAVLGVCTGKAQSCSVGQILNNDGSCSNSVVSGKTPIGVVVYISGGSDKCGQALALKDLGEMYWSTEYVDVPDLPNYNSNSVEKDFDSCGNTQKIIKQGNASKYPAAWAAVNYAPSSVPATKGKWCLPAAGVGRSMMNNYDKINSGLSKAGGESLPTLSNHDHWNWSSSENFYDFAWRWCYACDILDSNDKDGHNGFVRPVLAF